MDAKTVATGEVSPYQFFMLVLCLWSIVSLGAGSLWTLDGDTQTILSYADNAVCGLFLVDDLALTLMVSSISSTTCIPRPEGWPT